MASLMRGSLAGGVTKFLPNRCACGEERAVCGECGLGYSQRVPDPSEGVPQRPVSSACEAPSSSEDEAEASQSLKYRLPNLFWGFQE